MKHILLLPLLLLTFSSFGQIKFEPGYLINNQGIRQEILILNKDWKNNPEEFLWKVREEGSSQTSSFNEVREFGIDGAFRFVRFVVPVDRTPQDLEHLGTDPSPDFSDEMVYLRQLIAGKVDLFQYQDGSLKYFYYKTGEGEVEPLIFKKYRDGNQLLTNTRFRNQLFQDFNCGRINPQALREMEYDRRDMVDFFENHHSCIEADYTIVEDKPVKGDLRLLIKAGITTSSLEIHSGLDAAGTNIDFGPALRVGAEGEFILPFNQNKWALFLEATFNQLKQSNPPYETHDDLDPDESVLVLFKHNYIAVAPGAKYSFYFSDSFKLNLGLAAVFDVPIKSRIKFDRAPRYDVKPELNSLSTGSSLRMLTGISFRDRITVEFHYETGRSIGGYTSGGHDYVLDWRSDLKNLSISLGYRFI